MLRTLIIRNYVLIEKLELDFHSGFTSITGETGAGKSILLGAIGLLMGQRADHSVVRPGSERCIIEAQFELQADSVVQQLLKEEDIDYEEQELIIRREISLKGKSRSFVNDTPASLALLKRLSEYLIDIHSQHKNLLLGDAGFQLSVLDLYSNNSAILADYQRAYRQHAKLSKELSLAREQVSELVREQDYLQFQFSQLDEAQLQEGEVERLESEEQTLSHALEIKGALTRAYTALDDDERGALPALSTALDSLQSIRRYWVETEELHERLHSARLELRDIAGYLSQAEDRTDYDPERLQIISDRLDLLNSLLSKHGKTSVAELIALRDELDDKLQQINSNDEHLSELERALEEAHQQLLIEANALYQSRQASVGEIEHKLITGLRELGMPHVNFSIKLEHSELQLGLSGGDLVTFLFSANKEIAPEPVADIASGGEISRLMLSIKALIADRRHLPTIIFDEIDTGVSGDIADRIGLILQQMGRNMQVLAVTHLPQIAASGSRHLYVYKDHSEKATLSYIRYLEYEERIEEVARMQSGNNLTAVTLAAAQELLTNTQKRLQNETK